jgi:LysR family glycine cleavage system transcriptional activator
MPRSLPPLTALRAFESAARLLSFTRAARELHVTPAAISHQVRGLEKFLGVTLFRRAGRRLALTDQGRVAAGHFREGFERIARGVRQLSTDDSGVSITVSVTSAFATRWLVPRLGRFARRCPGIDLKIIAGAQPVDFDHDDVDVAVRIGRGGVAGAVAVPLFGERIAPLASPALIRQLGLRRVADLGRATLLHDDSMRRVGRTTGWPEWLGAARVNVVDSGRGMHFDDGHLLLQAAAAGRGVALGRLAYALDDLAARRLRIPFGPILELDLQYYLFVPDARVGEPAIAAFHKWIMQEAALFAPQLRAVTDRARPPQRTA